MYRLHLHSLTTSKCGQADPITFWSQSMYLHLALTCVFSYPDKLSRYRLHFNAGVNGVLMFAVFCGENIRYPVVFWPLLVLWSNVFMSGSPFFVDAVVLPLVSRYSVEQQFMAVTHQKIHQKCCLFTIYLHREPLIDSMLSSTRVRVWWHTFDDRICTNISKKNTKWLSYLLYWLYKM